MCSKSSIYIFRYKLKRLKDFLDVSSLEDKNGSATFQEHYKCSKSYNEGYAWAKSLNKSIPDPMEQPKDPNSFWIGFMDRIAESKVGKSCGMTRVS